MVSLIKYLLKNEPVIVNSVYRRFSLTFLFYRDKKINQHIFINEHTK